VQKRRVEGENREVNRVGSRGKCGGHGGGGTRRGWRSSGGWGGGGGRGVWGEKKQLRVLGVNKSNLLNFPIRKVTKAKLRAVTSRY